MTTKLELKTPVYSTRPKQGCDLYVPLDYLTKEDRLKAAIWAMEQFGVSNVDPFCLGPNEGLGFWFRNQKDAMWFKLRWLS